MALTVDRLNECKIVTNHKKKVGVNYHIIECTGNSISLETRQLQTRCGGESQHPAEGILKPQIEQFGDQTRWWQDAVEKASILSIYNCYITLWLGVWVLWQKPQQNGKPYLKESLLGRSLKGVRWWGLTSWDLGSVENVFIIITQEFHCGRIYLLLS